MESLKACLSVVLVGGRTGASVHCTVVHNRTQSIDRCWLVGWLALDGHWDWLGRNFIDFNLKFSPARVRRKQIKPARRGDCQLSSSTTGGEKVFYFQGKINAGKQKGY